MKRIEFLSVLLLVSWLAAFASGQQNSDEDSTGVHLKVVPLKHTEAAVASEILLHLVDDVRLSINSATNSIVLAGSKDDIELVSQIISNIDVEPPKMRSQHELYFVAYDLNSPEKTQQTFDVLASLFSGRPDIRMDRDQTDSKLFVYGRKDDHEIAENLINEMSKEPRKNQVVENNFHVSFVFVVESAQVDEADQIGLKPVDDPYAKVIQQAKRRGLLSFEKPMVATRVTSLVQSKIERGQPQFVQRSRSPGGSQLNKKEGYFANSSRTQKTRFSLAVTGNLLQQVDGEFKLETELLLGVPAANNDNESAKLSTSIQMPIEHPVLLSFSTVGGVDSAVILQVSRQ